jgi:8-oxo-dGTP diphosphatase
VTSSGQHSAASGGTEVLVADAHVARQGGDNRPCTEVAVGILLRPDGRFLLTTRPQGKAYAGHWEFPGGKLEAGEDVVQALVRELHEELGIAIHGAQIWREQCVDYPHALVRLHFCKVTRWIGELVMREGQHYSWEVLPVTVSPVLAGTFPVLSWLGQEK